MTVRYKLTFGGSDIGDELIMPVSYWQGKTISKSSDDGLEHIASLDGRPISVRLYPQFQIRKKTDDFREFERWVFDLVNWADGVLRRLWILDAQSLLVSVDYGLSKFIGIKRPQANGPYSARWSDSVIVTFQSDTQPTFFDYDL